MTEDSSDWRKNKVKGSYGEVLIKTLLECSGHKVVDYGIENRIIEIKEFMIKNRKGDTNIRIKCTPDYLVFANNYCFLFEIKTKKGFFNGKLLFDKNEIENYRHYWWDAFIIFLFPDVKDSIYCVRLKDIGDERKISTSQKGKQKWDLKDLFIDLNKLIFLDENQLKSTIESVNKINHFD